MLIIGYCYGVRSERKLCEEVSLNLAYRWFCRLNLDDAVPNHSSFSKNRHGRFRDSELLREVFERVVGICLAAGLIKGEGFSVDASVIEADASRYHGIAPEKIDWSAIEKPSRAVREYLEALDEAEEAEEEGRKAPKVVSPSDPASAWTAKANKRVQFGYGLNYLIDNAHAIIVDVEPTPARTFDEVRSTKTMLERAQKRFGLKPKRLAADTAYGTGKFLDWLVGHKIAPHIPVWDKGEREDGTFSRSEFVFDPAQAQYSCPAGKTLKQYRRNFTVPRRDNAQNGVRKYRASKRDCRSCEFKARCCPEKLRRVVFHAAFTKKPAIRRGSWRERRSSSNLKTNERRSRCSCASQDHASLREDEAPRPQRSQGRVPDGRHSAKPEAARPANGAPATWSGLRKGGKTRRALRERRSPTQPAHNRPS